MTEQLTLDGEKQTVCHNCGLPRPDRATPEWTNVLKDRCSGCRVAAGEDTEECDGCREQALEGDLTEQFFYMSPFDDEESGTGLKYCPHCFEDNQGELDEGTFNCERCERQIAEDRGHMTYYRIIDECEMVCLRCVEDILRSEGLAGFENELNLLLTQGRLFGMFFNVGELELDGWTRELYDVKVGSEAEAMVIAHKAQELHEDGRRIIIGYERMSIMGDEGYVTLFSKEPLSTGPLFGAGIG